MDFKFIQNNVSKKWIISAPRRAKRPDSANGEVPLCPFCPESILSEKSVYEISSQDPKSGWLTKVINNKYPFAQIHEIIIHSPDHHKSFDELPLTQSELIFKTFRERFKVHKDSGHVYIFHNHGEAAGESLLHPHSQLVVIPDFVKLDIPPIDLSVKEDFQETEHFTIFAPISSEWPDEVWLKPKAEDNFYADISDLEIKDLAKAMYRLIQIFDLRHGSEFPFNFYISPFKGWYLRIVPRIKRLGGFEVGTNIGVNTQSPQETIKFIKEHFEVPNEAKIKTVHQADYKKAL